MRTKRMRRLMSPVPGAGSGGWGPRSGGTGASAGGRHRPSFALHLFFISKLLLLFIFFFFKNSNTNQFSLVWNVIRRNGTWLGCRRWLLSPIRWIATSTLVDRKWWRNFLISSSPPSSATSSAPLGWFIHGLTSSKKERKKRRRKNKTLRRRKSNNNNENGLFEEWSLSPGNLGRRVPHNPSDSRS